MGKFTKYFFVFFLVLSAFPLFSFGQKYTGLKAVASDNKSTTAMFDNNISTRWQDASNLDNAWFVVDLGSVKTINTIKVFWENANAKSYTISFSTDNITFSGNITYSNLASGSRTDLITLANPSYRYIKFQGITRALNYGYSIYEFEVYASDPANFSSNLPIVVINTDINPSTGKPRDIVDDPKVLGDMKIIYRPDGGRNSVSDQNTPAFLNYNGRIGIEFRGSSSQDLPKKPYGLTTLKADNITNNNVSILGMPKENDWILNSLAFDPSLIRDFLSYELSRSMGNYSARGVYCEVIINNDYKGLYILMEKLKIDTDRINILKMTPEDITGQNLTGGYVTKCDKTTGGDPVAWRFASSSGGWTDFIHDNPKPTEITSQQHNYIYNQFNTLKNLTANQNSSISTGYPGLIDVPSFVDFMIMNEISSNADGYQLSTFFHKDRNGKLRAGPIWDFNLTYGNDLFVYGFNRSHTNVWQFDDGGNTGAILWKDLFNNPAFKCYLSKRWLEVTAPNEPLNFTLISNRIDQIVNHISEATIREQARWGTVGNHAGHISSLKTWLQTRMNWLQSSLNNSQACSNIILPALVISKINYNPLYAGGFASDSLEFIEISNNSNQTIDLTGIYFRELGITYQFPANSSLSANGKLILASNANAFEQVYGNAPFGQFTRNLPNNTQKLVLADAFGNIIDFVEYSDLSPWPVSADGLGPFLELIDLKADNSLASNWKASTELFSALQSPLKNDLRIYPSPAQESITIVGDNAINSYEITDLMGRTVRAESQFHTKSNIINIENLTPHIYLIKFYFEDGTSTIRKIIKI
jgi:hypothetical protein